MGKFNIEETFNSRCEIAKWDLWPNTGIFPKQTCPNQTYSYVLHDTVSRVQPRMARFSKVAPLRTQLNGTPKVLPRQTCTLLNLMTQLTMKLAAITSKIKILRLHIITLPVESSKNSAHLISLDIPLLRVHFFPRIMFLKCPECKRDGHCVLLLSTVQKLCQNHARGQNPSKVQYGAAMTSAACLSKHNI